ncbi:MAG: uroporphyrinogen-III decarboxylase-like protein [Anaerolineae bacterium]|nr:uroporphyrinogen-III decarboxylase-like protein [Anaerolineae bacterium]
MTRRERVLAAIERRPLDRLPTDMWATPEVSARLQRLFGCADMMGVWDCLDVDGIVSIGPEYVGPPLPDLGPDRRVDEWGMEYRRQDYLTGAYWEQVGYPLAQAQTIADVDAYPWPSPDWYDYSVMPDLPQARSHRAVQYGYTAIFFWHNKLRGLEQSLTDPILHPEFTRHLLRRITDTFMALYEPGFQAARGRVDVTQVTDDFGSQSGLLISHSLFTDFYRPEMERAIAMARSYSLKVFHHDDGAMREIIPDLIEMGIDVLNPIQWRCPGMEQEGLARDFGDRLCFHGGVDNQQTLPFGSPDDVWAEVEHNLKTLGANGTGYVVAPCHNIQPNTPTENILALYQAARAMDKVRPTQPAAP